MSTPNIFTLKESDTTSKGTIKKYPALRAISGIINVMAYIILIASIILVFVGIFAFPSFFFVVIAIMVGALLFVSLRASSELILVFIDIEENTGIAATESIEMNKAILKALAAKPAQLKTNPKEGDFGGLV